MDDAGSVPYMHCRQHALVGQRIHAQYSSVTVATIRLSEHLDQADPHEILPLTCVHSASKSMLNRCSDSHIQSVTLTSEGLIIGLRLHVAIVSDELCVGIGQVEGVSDGLARYRPYQQGYRRQDASVLARSDCPESPIRRVSAPCYYGVYECAASRLQKMLFLDMQEGIAAP